MAEDEFLTAFESDAKKQFQTSSFARKASGNISIDLDSGAVSTSGKLTDGTFKKTEMWAVDFFDSVNWSGNQAFLQLYETSKEHPNGPIYKCVITFHKGRPEFRYHFEKAPISSLSDIAKDNHGGYPLFAYRNYFTEELIEASNPGELRIGHQALLEVLLSEGEEVSEDHMAFYALNDFISDFYNGGLNQYFNRSVTWDLAKYNRAELYPALKKALVQMERADVSNMFDEAIALYSPHYEHVEEARRIMRIPAAPEPEESNIGSRFWDIIDELESDTESFMKANKSRFAYH